MNPAEILRRSRLLISFCIAVGLVLAGCAGSKHPKSFKTAADLGLPKLTGRVPTYYSTGASARAEKLQKDIADMAAFFRERLGTRVEVTIDVLNPQDWVRVSPLPYGLPGYYGSNPPVIFMPATPGGLVSQMALARRDAIPPEMLGNYLQANHTSFDTVAENFVDIVGFHELGHILCASYGISAPCRWLDELIASYFAYAFISEQRPELKPIFDLLGRPSYRRPKNTSLADFERLYAGVDDYGWYQGMFEMRIRDVYPRMGIAFLQQLRAAFPSQSPPGVESAPPSSGIVLERLEALAPGFKAWAEGFGHNEEPIGADKHARISRASPNKRMQLTSAAVTRAARHRACRTAEDGGRGRS